MSHSIFVREYLDGNVQAPQMVAYDIEQVSLANRLVRRIAKSHTINGYDNYTGRRWFKMKDRLVEVYRIACGKEPRR
jgi:hypothetical protein